jgi:SRSO17 transposase
LKHAKVFDNEFNTSTHRKLIYAIAYVKGLMLTGRGLRNMESIADKLGDINYQDLQQFVSDSPWDHLAVFKKITSEISNTFDTLVEDTRRGLIFDESGFSKKGIKSVGVARQYCGRSGKVDNCQIGVYSAIVQQDEVCLNNAWLYLPESWTDDKSRCIEAGIPEDDIEFRTKGQISALMAEEYFSTGNKAYWVGGDSVYGDCPELKTYLDSIGQKYVLDISPVFNFYLNDPKIHSEEQSLSCNEILNTLTHRDFKKVRIRQGVKGWIETHICVKEVWYSKQSLGVEKRLLVIKKEKESNRNGKRKIKYSISNFDLSETTVEELAWMQSQRFWVEQSFRNAKTVLGMDDYQLRKWVGWHHHMALVMMAMHFLVTERIVYRQKSPLFTFAETMAVIAAKLSGEEALLEDILLQIERNHGRTKESLRRFYAPG